MELVSRWSTRFVLVGAGNSDAGAVDEYFNDQALLRLSGVECPALQYVALQADNGTGCSGGADDRVARLGRIKGCIGHQAWLSRKVIG
ncbi:hypothetical protein [Pseudomonas sp.]|uniref:hypothetical protein n=1 Tax=Pseudomonas sp. TaxID=306 RepID=UPI0027BA413B|nr:hypothetical protein [Pseudomonas sp.]